MTEKRKRGRPPSERTKKQREAAAAFQALTPRQKNYVMAEIDRIKSGKVENEKASIMQAGYSSGVASTVVKNNANVSRAIVAALDAAGVTVDKLSLRINEGLDASDSTGAPSLGMRHKYIETALRARGDMYPDNTPTQGQSWEGLVLAIQNNFNQNSSDSKIQAEILTAEICDNSDNNGQG